MSSDETCCACSGTVSALVVDGSHRKGVCEAHDRLYRQQGYEILPLP